jgi:hypothetical protein
MIITAILWRWPYQSGNDAARFEEHGLVADHHGLWQRVSA